MVFHICNSSHHRLQLEGVEIVKKAGLDDKQIMSNAWVHMNYYGIESVPYPGVELIDYFIQQGFPILIFKTMYTEDLGFDKKNITYRQFPILFESNEIVMLGNDNINQTRIPGDITYLELRKFDIKMRVGEDLDIDPCNLLIQDIFFNMLCHSINAESTRPESIIDHKQI